MKHNKIALVFLLVVVVLGTFAAVSAQDDTLVIWADETRVSVLLELADQVQSDLGIALEVQQIGLPEARDQLLVAGPVGEGPDVLIIASDSLGLLTANAAIVPIELDDLAQEFSEGSLNLFTFNGQLWALPYAAENVALVRNTDLVAEAPQTWQEVAEISREIHAADPEKYGFLLKTADTYHTYPITSAFGGYIFGLNADGSYNTADIGIGSEGGLAAAQWMADLYADGVMVPNIGDDESFALFEEGRLGMFITGPWWSQRIVDTGIPYSIDPLPGAEGGLDQGVPFVGGQGFVISAFSEKQLLAEAFLLDFIATDDGMQALFDADPRPPAWLNVDTSTDPNLGAFAAAGVNAVAMPAIPEMGAVWGPSNNMLTAISTGSDPAEAVASGVAQIQQAVQIAQSEERIVGLPGSHQAAVGCPGDWDPACEVTFLTDQGDGIYTITLTIPAGDYEYKVAMNGGWDENYGVDGAAGGDNLKLSLAEESTVTFTYDDNTHIVTAEVGE